MSLIDRSPAAFIVMANVVVFGTIGVEVWMWIASSVLAVAFTLALIAATAGAICLYFTHLLEDATGMPSVAPAVAVAEPAAVAAAAPAPAATRASARRAPRPAMHAG